MCAFVCVQACRCGPAPNFQNVDGFDTQVLRRVVILCVNGEATESKRSSCYALHWTLSCHKWVLIKEFEKKRPERKVWNDRLVLLETLHRTCVTAANNPPRLFPNNRFARLSLFRGVAQIFKWALKRVSKEGDRMKDCCMRISAAATCNLQSCAVKQIIAPRPQSNHCQVQSRLIIPNASNNPPDNSAQRATPGKGCAASFRSSNRIASFFSLLISASLRNCSLLDSPQGNVWALQCARQACIAHPERHNWSSICVTRKLLQIQLILKLCAPL